MLKAKDRELGRVIAVKELLERTPRSEIRFFREALITARLEHPSIVSVHEAGRWPDGTPFYAMKLVAGRPLSNLIDECSTFEQRTALLPHVIAAADAVSYAHDRRIIHRDLKPSNVIVGDFGETVVIDWGLAKDLTSSVDDPHECDLASSTSSELTAAGTVLGTPAYMAPEQARGEPVDERSDVYALGAMLRHVIAGTAMATLPQTVTANRDLAAIVERATAADPRERYPSARAFAAELRAFLARKPVTARRYGLIERATLFTARHRAVTAAALVFSIALSVVLVVALAAVDAERRVAVDARRSAERAEAATDAARDELLLQAAALQLERDPTAAARLLADYDGENVETHDRLLAEAYGRGIATFVGKPHSDSILLTVVAANGDIVTVGGDGALVVTSEHDVRTIADDVDVLVVPSYSPSSDAVIFKKRHGGMWALDLRRHGTYPLSFAIDRPPQEIALTPDGASIAIRYEESVAVHRVSGELLMSIAGRWRAVAAMDDGLLLTGSEGVTFVSLAGERVQLSTRPARVQVRDNTAAWIDGDALNVWAGGAAIDRHDVCGGRVASFFVGRRGMIAFACAHGGVGAIEALRGDVKRFYVVESEQVRLSMSDDGRFVASVGEDRIINIFDTRSSLRRMLRGHAGPVTGLVVDVDHMQLISSDRDGSLRRWELRHSAGRLLFTVDARTLSLKHDVRSDAIVVAGTDGALYFFDVSNESLQLVRGGHDGAIRDLDASSETGLLSIGLDGRVSLWSRPPREVVRSFLESHRYTDAAILPGANCVVSTAHTAELHLWNADPSRDRTIPIPTTPAALESLPGQGAVAVLLSNGELWTLSAESKFVRRVQADRDAILLRSSPSGEQLAIGTSSGRLVVYDTTAWTIVDDFAIHGAVRSVDFSPDGASVAVSVEPVGVHYRDLVTRTNQIVDLSIRGRIVRFSPDGNYLAIAAGDGAVWLFDTRARRWSVIELTLRELRYLDFVGSERIAVLDELSHIYLLDVALSFESKKGRPK